MQNNMTRHVGKIANTDQRCVVALMSIPGRADHALVIPTNSLPPKYEQAVMEVLQSQEGQAARDLANVLHRRLMPDNGKTVLAALHENKMLQAVPASNVLMLPKPNMPFRLSDIVRDMQILEGGGLPTAQPVIGTTDLPPINPVPGETPFAAPPYMDPSADPARFNPYLHNQQANASEQNHAIATNLLLEAQMLENEAHNKRERAYGFAPDLRAAQAASPDITPVWQSVLGETQSANLAQTPKPRKSRAKAATAKPTTGKPTAKTQAAPPV